MKSLSIYSFIFLSISALFGSCTRQAISISKDITFSTENKLKLDVYAPKKINTPKKVLVFIHGGSWKNGEKATYKFFGKGMSRKGVVTVVIDYRLYPLTTYEGMAADAATAIKWVKQNITVYGGDTNKIYVSGHSAGGNLAALVATDDHYFDALKMKNPIKGTILIDAFGLDMYKYLLKNESYEKEVYHSVFTNDTANWKLGSPAYHLHRGMPPFLMYVGGKTYPNIVTGSYDFLAALKKYQPDAYITTVPGKRHAGMIFSFLNPHKKAYKEIIDFMEK
jgi:acetyl esterase/lipase